MAPAAAYNHQSRKWYDSKSVLTFSSNLNSSFRSSVYNAANTWTSVSGSSFYFYNSSTDTCYTSVQLGAVAQPNYLAQEQAIMYNNSYKQLSLVTFSNTRNWTTNSTLAYSPFHYDIQTVALHELGHAAGMSHSNDENALMRASALPSVMRTLTVDDTAGIRALYPSYRHSSNGVLDNVEIYVNATIEPMTEEEMAEKATLIVKGSVKEILPAQWDTSDGSDPSIRTKDTYSTEGYMLYHDTVIEVDKIYKGKLSEESGKIIVRLPGGSTGSITMIDDNSAQYSKGEQVLLYLFEDTGTRSYSLGPEHYFAYPRQGQIFIDNESKIAVNGYGEKVDIKKLLSASASKN
ncbi:matrixin family metalloprotease [Methanolapillus millepedarum]